MSEGINISVTRSVNDPNSMKSVQSQSSKLRGYLTVLGGFSIHLFCGCLYLWGSIQNYVLSYFHNIKGDDSVTPEMTSLFLTISIFAQTWMAYFVAFVQYKIHPRVLMIVGSLIMLGALLAASFCSSWWLFVLFYAVLFPAGIGIVYWMPILCGWEWFPEKKGAVAGAVVAGYGLGSFFFGFLTTYIVNPNNISPHGQEDEDDYFPDEVAKNVPRMIQICLSAWAVLCILGILFVQRNPDHVRNSLDWESRHKLIDKHNSSYNDVIKSPGVGYRKGHISDDDEDKLMAAYLPVDEERDYVTYIEALKSPRFYILFFQLFFGIFYGIYMAAVYKQISQDYLDDHTLTLAGMIGSVCNGCSRYFWASLQDMFGFKKVYLLIMTIQLSIAATIWYVKDKQYLYPVWVALSFLCEGAHFSCFPAVTSRIFGMHDSGKIFTMIFMNVPFSSLLSYFLVHLAKTESIDWFSKHTIFLIAAGFSLINIVLLFFLNDNPIKENGDYSKSNKDSISKSTKKQKTNISKKSNNKSSGFDFSDAYQQENNFSLRQFDGPEVKPTVIMATDKYIDSESFASSKPSVVRKLGTKQSVKRTVVFSDSDSD